MGRRRKRGRRVVPSHLGSHPLATPKASTVLGDSIQIPVQIHEPHSHLDPSPENHQTVASDNHLA